MVSICPLVITAYRLNFNHLFSYCYIASYNEVELTQSTKQNVSLRPNASVTAIGLITTMNRAGLCQILQ